MLNARINRKPISRATQVATAMPLLGIAVLIAGFGASAQSPSAAVSGIVRDQHGTAVPDVAVTLTLAEAERPASITVLTDDTGSYEFDLGLRPGKYWLDARRAGFAAVEQTLTLEAGQTVQRNLTLAIGTVQETIVVGRAGAPPPDPPPPLPPPPPPGKIDRLRGRVEHGTVTTRESRDGRATVSSHAVAVGGNIKRPEMVKRVDPVYPDDLMDAGIEGRVNLKARIDATGFLTGMEVLGSPHPELAKAAIEAVSQWQYEPTLLNGEPVETHIEISVYFGAPDQTERRK